MAFSRRNFMKAAGLGAAGSAVARWPIAAISTGSIFEPLRAAEPEGSIVLSNNENAYGPSEKVRAALQTAVGFANRYEHGEYENLIDQIASLHHVARNQVLLGCGSSEILSMAAAAFLGPGKKLVIASPTYEAMAHHGETFGAEIVRTPLTRQYSHDLEAMLGRATSPGMVYICNPNNPTATLTPRSDIESFLNKLPPNVYVLIDEAYHHFVGASPAYASFIDRPLDDPRVIVTRTFSKIYALAGTRLGYAIASAQTINRMRPFQFHYSVSTIAARVGMIALDDTEGVRTAAKRNADDRQDFFNRAQTRNFNPIPSQTNFVMMNVERPVEEVIEHFQKNNILVGRPFPPMNTFLRISLGTPPQMGDFWRVWDLMHIQKSHH